MTVRRTYAALLLAALASAGAVVYSLRAQQQVPQPAALPTANHTANSSAPAMNHNLVVLDAAHGGDDAGAVISEKVKEKDVTLALSGRLRGVLTGAGFSVATTRDAELFEPMTTDQRAEMANRQHAVACIVLHATSTGSGVHLYTSTLSPFDPPESVDGETAPFAAVPWETAQAGSVRQSLRLAADLKSALAGARLPLVQGKAAVSPLDSLMCPAVVVELAPLSTGGGDATPVTDAGYQQRVLDAVATALKNWKTHADPTDAAANGDKPADVESSSALRAIAAAEVSRRIASGQKATP